MKVTEKFSFDFDIVNYYFQDEGKFLDRSDGTFSNWNIEMFQNVLPPPHYFSWIRKYIQSFINLYLTVFPWTWTYSPPLYTQTGKFTLKNCAIIHSYLKHFPECSETDSINVPSPWKMFCKENNWLGECPMNISQGDRDFVLSDKSTHGNVCFQK